MKLTVNIDDELLNRVMETTGATTKTAAIHAALAEIDRRNKLIALLSKGLEMKEGDWENAFDEASWTESGATARAAETPATYNARKPRSRR